MACIMAEVKKFSNKEQTNNDNNVCAVKKKKPHIYDKISGKSYSYFLIIHNLSISN